MKIDKFQNPLHPTVGSINLVIWVSSKYYLHGCAYLKPNDQTKPAFRSDLEV